MKRRGFTLIELLVVVAIISILALIVLPNFLSAQVKARVARSRADIHSVGNALLAYRVDNNQLPPIPLGEGQTQLLKPLHLTTMNTLTTPVSYINAGSVRSPFSDYNGYWYYNWEFFKLLDGNARTFFWNNENNGEPTTWMVSTIGPDTDTFPYRIVSENFILWNDYDPTNGVVSAGIVQKHGD